MNALGTITRRGVEESLSKVLSRVTGVREVAWSDVEDAPSPAASGAFSVRVTTGNQMAAPSMARGRKGTGIGMDFAALIRFAWRLSPRARIESRRTALDQIDLIQTSIMSTTAPELLGMSLRDWSDNEGEQSEWRVWDLTVTVSGVIDYPATAAA